MINLNCPKCNVRSAFTQEKKKFKCNQCKTIFKQCKTGSCSNLLRFGLVCKMCLGKGIRKGGGIGTGILAGLATIAIKFFKK